mmetsp:Transcript_35001/g.90673  ORF Transcript_35001/g.90673 Transcript_35001/m.90673 type:complete len:94 (-) Transcript_35001:1193-1474(-)
MAFICLILPSDRPVSLSPTISFSLRYFSLLHFLDFKTLRKQMTAYGKKPTPHASAPSKTKGEESAKPTNKAAEKGPQKKTDKQEKPKASTYKI